MSSSKTIIKIVVFVLVALTVVGVIGVVYKYTNGFNEDFKTFYVEYNGEKILAENTKMDITYNATHRFDVRYTFDSDDTAPKDYSVKVVVNPTKDFDFYVGGDRYMFSKAHELSRVFELNKQSTYFEITVPAGLTIRQALMSVYGEEVTLPDSAEENNPYPFKLVVSSYNAKVQYSIAFRLASGDVTGIALNLDGIEFWEDDL